MGGKFLKGEFSWICEILKHTLGRRHCSQPPFIYSTHVYCGSSFFKVDISNIRKSIENNKNEYLPACHPDLTNIKQTFFPGEGQMHSLCLQGGPWVRDPGRGNFLVIYEDITSGIGMEFQGRLQPILEETGRTSWRR